MLTKIKRQDSLDKYAIFPLRRYNYEKDEEVLFYPEVFKSYVLTLPSKSFKGHVKALGTEITIITKALDLGTLVFMGDNETPWQYQNNDYKPVKEAQAYLVANNIGKRFNGALQVDTSDLAEFIKHLTWLIRCNAALPYFHFIDEAQNIVGSICQYGSLHLNTLNEKADKLLNTFIVDSKFEFGDKNSCHNRFGRSSAISGRHTIV